MSAPSPPPPKATPGTLAFLIAAAILSTVAVMCGGLVVGVMFYLANRAADLNRKMEAAVAKVQQITGSPVTVSSPAMPPGVADWWGQRALAPVYPAAIDAVAQHPAVLERLGEPVEPREDAEELFRIKRDPGASNETASGAPPGAYALPETQSIEFDIKGPKGAAVVSVVASTASAGQPGSTYRAAEITVKFSDGTQIQVPPPKEQAGTVIQ